MAQNQKTQAELYREERKARLQKAAKKRNKKKMGKAVQALIAVVLVAVIAVGIGGYSFATSGKYRATNVIEITVGDETVKVSAAEFSFYYNSIFSNYFNMAYQYSSYYGAEYGAMFTGGYDYLTAPDQQKYSGDLEGYENPTWADYFEYSALQQMKMVKAFCADAGEKDVALDDGDMNTINDQLDEIKEAAGNSAVSTNKYLSIYYGKGVTKSLVKTIMEEQTLAQKYQDKLNQDYKDGLTEEEIEKVYNADKASYDVASVAYYLVEAEKVASAADEDGEETSEATAETMAVAKADAEALVKGVTSVEAFEKAVDTFAGEEDSVDKIEAKGKDDISQIDSKIADWIFGKKVKTGDTTVVEVAGSGYYVCYAVATPFRDETPTISVRHILIKFPEEKETSTDAEETSHDDAINPADYSDVVIDMQVNASTATDYKTYSQAEELLKTYLDGEKTEDSFAALAEENSEDTGSTENGGLYENVKPGDMVPQFNDWCFDASRQPGDVGMVETSYGYHIMYFVSTNEASWKHEIKDSLATEKLEEYVKGEITDENYPLEILKQDYIDSTIADTMKLANAQIANVQSQQTSSYGY